MNRRQMMKAFPALAAAATAVAHAMPAEAQAVTQQTPKAPPAYKGRLRPGVIALSYRPQLEAKEMTYEDIVRVIADLGLEGMEMTGYWLPPMLSFPSGTPSTQISDMVRKAPVNPTPQWLASLRNTAFKNGIDIYGVGSPVKMAQPTPELRQKEIVFGKKWIDIADAVGASSVRVFGGGIAQGATEGQAVEWAVEVYKPILDYAAAKGIVLGLEDDDDLTRTSAQLLTIVKKVNHPAARIALDCGNFRKNGYKECEICAPYASSTHVKPQMSRPDGQREPADWAKLFGILAGQSRTDVRGRADSVREDVLGCVTLITRGSPISDRREWQRLVSAVGRSSPCRFFLLRRRTDSPRRTRGQTRLRRAASRADPGHVPFPDRPASRRSRRLPTWRARALRRPR
jgi:sugar phosphate isomerase/epimerase